MKHKRPTEVDTDSSTTSTLDGMASSSASSTTPNSTPNSYADSLEPVTGTDESEIENQSYPDTDPDESRDHTETDIQVRSPLKLTLPSDYLMDHSSEFNDGTLSPLPADPHAYWTDAYAAAWNCMSEKEEEDYFNSPDYQYFENLMKEGRLVVSKRDLPNLERWRALGFFLSKNTECQSLRFQGVDLQVSDFHTFKQVLLKSSLANHHRPKKRTKEGNGRNVSYATTDCSSSSSSSSAASSLSSPLSHPVTPMHTEWTGGWGLDIDRIHAADSARRRNELRLRHIAFFDNNLGTHVHLSKEEVKHQLQQQQQQSHGHHALGLHPSSRKPRPSALENVISLLLFCELLETVHIWRNNLSDQHAVQLSEELLLQHPSLRKLSLRFNGVTADGAKQIEEILKKMSSNVQQTASPSHESSVGGGKFEELDLAFNRIDPTQVSTIFSEGYQLAPSLETQATNPSAPVPPTTTTVPLTHTPLSLTPPPPPKRPLFSVNLRSQLPHSQMMLSHFLRLTAVYPFNATRAYATTCGSMHTPTYGGSFHNPLLFRTVLTSSA